MLKKFVTVASLALGLAWANPARADVFGFDIDGNTGGATPQTATSFDWNVGNAIAIGVNAASPVGTTFQLFYQANLSVVNLSGGGLQVNNYSSTGGVLDSITIVVGFQETITSSTFDANTNTGVLNFGFASGGANFFQIYANDVPGDNLTGACFVCGTQIMAGTVTPTGYTSNFTGTGANVALDAFDSGTPPINNYSGVNSITGSGSVNLTGIVNTYNTDWFTSPLPPNFLQFAFANTTTKLNYQEADPSACFFAFTSTGGLTPTCTNSSANLTGVTPFIGVGSVGTNNGRTGPNLMFQADANSSFLVGTTVPEPATLTLLGFGLIGTAAARRRAKKAKK